LSFAANFLRWFWVLSLPFSLFLLGQEPHFGRFSLDPPAVLDGLEIAIDLDFVEGGLFVLAVLPLESGHVPVLVPPDVVAEIAVERRPVNLKQRYFFVETGGVEA
jgi:hypothetical protein